MTRLYKQARRLLPYIINEKDTVNTRISMKVAMKCFRDFLTESEMSANCKDSPVEYVILLWCKENIWGSFQKVLCRSKQISYSESDGYVCSWIVELQTTFLEIVVFKSTLIIQMSLLITLS